MQFKLRNFEILQFIWSIKSVREKFFSKQAFEAMNL